MALERREVVLDALRRARWILADAALHLGVSRQGLYKAMDRLAIPREPTHPDVLGHAKGRGRRRRTVAA